MRGGESELKIKENQHENKKQKKKRKGKGEMRRRQHKKYVIICVVVSLRCPTQIQDFFVIQCMHITTGLVQKDFQLRKKKFLFLLYFVYILFCTLQVGSTVTSHGRPLTELEMGIPSPHPLPLLSYLLCENVFSKSSDRQFLLQAIWTV